jgi:hypothetical protein
MPAIPQMQAVFEPLGKAYAPSSARRPGGDDAGDGKTISEAIS